jgi:pimeloyl-ACP methyl ester carboxylesterase
VTTDALQPLKIARAGVLEIAYHDAGPADGEAVFLLHGFPYDIHSYVDVVLRGHGPTRFVDESTPRSGQQAALGVDVVELMDALDIPRALLAGYDWGGRAACIVAALWPERCAGLISVNGYLIQDIAASTTPIRPDLEAGFWYFFYFATERGRRGLTENRREIARVIWTRNSPRWQFDDTTLDRAAEAFENDDYVDVVIHSYRHRLGLVPGYPQYEEIETRLAQQPPIGVPAITLDGQADGNFPATDGTSSSAHFLGPRTHLQVRDAGHNLPQEAPATFADAVFGLARRPQ